MKEDLYRAVVEYYIGPPHRTLQEVGDAFGLTRERVRQIVEEHGPGTYPRVTKTQTRRFMRAIAKVAEIEERRQEHGTLRRYRGYCKVLGPCHCEECRRANREHTYKVLGYTPMMTREEYNRFRRLGLYEMRRK